MAIYLPASAEEQDLALDELTPREIVAVIQQRAKAALSAPDVLERLRITGNEAVASTPDAFEQRFKADLAKFAKIVKEAHIPAQD